MRVNLTWTKYDSSAEYGCVVFRVAGVLSCRCFLNAILHWLRGGGGGAESPRADFQPHRKSSVFKQNPSYFTREHISVFV